MKTSKGLLFLCTFLLLLGIASTSLGVITPNGPIGTATNTTTGNSLVITTTSAVAAGDDIIVAFATYGDPNYTISVADSEGNTYVEAAQSVCYQHGRTYIFAAYNVNALSSGSAITITHTSVAVRAAVASSFSGLAEVNVLDQSLGNPVPADQEQASGITPTVGPTGTTEQANELLIGAVGTEGPFGDDAGTWENGFTAGPRTGTTLGTPTDNWTVSMGYRIVSSTGAYTAQKSGITSRYWAAAIATFKTENILLSSSYNIVLGRPTDDSVTANVIMNYEGDISFEYGTASGSYGTPTTAIPCPGGEPVEVVINGLDSDTQYFYRLRYRATGGDPWTRGAEYSFHTQRAQGEAFTFTITSDSHLGQTFSGNDPARHNQTTLNIAAEHPDFNLDLGDSFIMSLADNQSQVDDIYLDQRRDENNDFLPAFFGNFSHSSPIFLVMGNHEDEEGWNLDDSPFSKGIASIIARKKYYSNPIPDTFYSGNNDLLPSPSIGDNQLREDYYSWTWGDALFIVLDPFQYTMIKPYGNVQGSGEEDDETVSGDQWNWTLGQQQYNWFKQTLENSNAKFKFVFSHHVVGGQLEVSNSQAGPPEYVRGGAMAADYFEWGGSSDDPIESNYDFDTKRNGWGDPIHQLMIDNHVSAFFHGHDHQFVYEKIDDIVYQLVPSTGMNTLGFDLYSSSPYVQTVAPYGIGNLPSAGHLRVTVSEDETTVDYVRSAISGDTDVTNGEVSYTYTIDPNEPVNDCQADIQPAEGDGDVDGSDLAAWMGGSSGITLENVASEFGRTDCLQ